MMQTANDTRNMLSAAGIIDRSKPTTGVFSMNALENINEEIDDAIDLDFETYCREHCQQDSEDCECDYESMGDNTYLIGFKWNDDTKEYDIDDKAEYSAIVNSGQNTVQVVKSVWYLTGGLCSPCYPGQVDADSMSSDIVAYALPPGIISEIFCDGLNELSSRIFLLKHKAMIEDGIELANPMEYADYDYRRPDKAYYRISLDRSTAVIVAGHGCGHEVLDIAIDYATEKKWNIFLSSEDIAERRQEAIDDGHDSDYYLSDYWQGGNESKYLADMGCQGISLVMP